MSPTRRAIFRFSVAALVGRALPTGARPVAALAADNALPAVEVLDHDPMREVVFSCHMLAMGAAKPPHYSGCRSRIIYLYGFRDGIGEILIQSMEPLTKTRESQPQWSYRKGYRTPDPEPAEAFPMVRMALDRDLFAAFHSGVFGTMSTYDKTVDDFHQDEPNATLRPV